MFIVSRLPNFCDLYLDLNLEIVFSDESVDFSMREADCAIRFGRSKTDHPDLVHQHLFNINLKVCGSKIYFEKQRCSPHKSRKQLASSWG